jgi:hypothetical protein
MPAINFQARFVPAVENGVARIRRRRMAHPDIRPKRQTIRAWRKDGRNPRAGCLLYLYTGMRTKKCRKLGEVRCRHTATIEIDANQRVFMYGRLLWLYQCEALAHADGFEHFETFIDWIDQVHGLPFSGWVIRW